MAYSAAEGVFVAAIPDNCQPGGPGALIFPGAKHPDWGPADVPPASAFQPAQGASPAPATPGPAAKKLKLAVTRSGKVTVTVPGPGKVTVTARRKARTVAKLTKTAKAAGTLTFRLKVRGKVTVTASQSRLTARRTLTLRG